MATISLTQPGGGGSQSQGGTIYPGARCYPAFSSTATSYVWSLQSTPSGSSTTMLSGSGLAPYFDPDIAGNYAFRLVATGGSDAGTYDCTVVCIARNAVTPQIGYLGSYEPDFMGATVSTVLSCNTNTSGVVSFVPFVLPSPMVVGMAEVALSMSFVTVGNSSAQNTFSQSWGIYSRIGGATGTALTQMMASSFTIGFTGNNSTYSVNQPTSTAYTGYSTGATTSAGSNISSGYTGAKLVQLPVNLTLSAGQYWLGLANFNSSSSTSGGLSASYIGLAGIATLATLAPIGSFSANYSTGTVIPLGIGGNWNMGLASFTSVGQTNLPASVGLSLFTQNVFVQPFLKLVGTS